MTYEQRHWAINLSVIAGITIVYFYFRPVFDFCLPFLAGIGLHELVSRLNPPSL